MSVRACIYVVILDISVPGKYSLTPECKVVSVELYGVKDKF